MLMHARRLRRSRLGLLAASGAGALALSLPLATSWSPWAGASPGGSGAVEEDWPVPSGPSSTTTTTGAEEPTAPPEEGEAGPGPTNPPEEPTTTTTAPPSTPPEGEGEPSPGPGDPGATELHLLAFNDFHGALEPGSSAIYGRYAGGAAYLAKKVKDLQATYGEHQATVMAGDGVGASQLASSLFFEEPAIVALNLMGVDFASVGNHEFDKGAAELRRLQEGGCHPTEGCTGAPYQTADGPVDTFPGASFQYLSANVIDEATGETLFPATAVKTFPSDSGGTLKVGFIGEVLEATPTIVTPAGVAGLTFTDEVEAANEAVAALQAEGVNTIVLVIHEGGSQATPPPVTAPNGCQGDLAGSAIEAIASGLDPAVGVIISGHTHTEYRCNLSLGGADRLITSASSLGRVLTDVTVTVDDATGELRAASATNHIVENSTNPSTETPRVDDPTKADPAVAAVVAQYVDAAAPLANEVIGTIAGDLTREPSAQGESTLGDVIADSQLAATTDAEFGGAQIAFMNPGGIRAELLASAVSAGGEAPGEVTYGEAFSVQPFGNSLVTKTMTGAQIRSLLEQQYVGCGGQTTQRILQVSAGFSYTTDATAEACADKVGTISLDGAPIEDNTTYRVTMNSFLASGGDGFTAFNDGTDSLGGAQDIDALIAYFEAHPDGVAVPARDRILPVG
jgi:5'-nucleotidase